VLDNIPYKAEILDWLIVLETMVRERFFVLDSLKQIALLIVVFLVGQLIKGKLISAIEAIHPPKVLAKYPGFIHGFEHRLNRRWHR
jgi:hypothetical protein